MNIKTLVKILDNNTTPNTRSIEFPYYDSIAKDILKEIESTDRKFTVDDMLSFAVYAIRLGLSHPIFLEEKHITDWQTEYCESVFIHDTPDLLNQK